MATAAVANPVPERNEEDENDGSEASQKSEDPVTAMLADDATQKVEELSSAGPHHATDARMWRGCVALNRFFSDVLCNGG